jgi:hypothetical protein
MGTEFGAIRSAMMRAAMSVLPPAMNGTTRLIGRSE